MNISRANLITFLLSNAKFKKNEAIFVKGFYLDFVQNVKCILQTMIHNWCYNSAKMKVDQTCHATMPKLAVKRKWNCCNLSLQLKVSTLNRMLEAITILLDLSLKLRRKKYCESKKIFSLIGNSAHNFHLKTHSIITSQRFIQDPVKHPKWSILWN